MSKRTHLIYEDEEVRVSTDIDMIWSKEKIGKVTLEKLSERHQLSMADEHLVMRTIEILIDAIDRAYHTGYDEGIENLRAAILMHKGIDLNGAIEISSEEQK